MADCNFVDTRFGIYADPVVLAGAWGKVFKGFVAAGNGKVVNKGDRVEAATGNAKMPNEVGNVNDMFLMVGTRIITDSQPVRWGKETDPVHAEQVLQLLHDDFGFVDATMRGFAGGRLGIASVDAKFVIEDGAADSFGNKGVPVFMNNGGEAGAVVKQNGIGEADDLVKFGLVFENNPDDMIILFD